ncbi:hypothetical protein P692DRAFT_20748575 [Suillus brevipes Sb2]|nr:hypothetical protein P692DRAFT_20748575 [Suillus brevipes Sb2]
MLCTPELETKCAYQHLFKYGFMDHGFKNNPCQNVSLKCGLCYPILPPKPGRNSRKVPAAFVQSVWRYNMTVHILTNHEKYVIPGCREAGVVLPGCVWKSMELSELEQACDGIPQECRQPLRSATAPVEQGKENIPLASGSRSIKCLATASAGSMLSKCARTTIQPLQPAFTLVV